MRDRKYRPDRILDYFRAEWRVLAAVTVSGLIYNLGLLAGPWFEGKMAGCLMRILTGEESFSAMLRMAVLYVFVIGMVQLARYIKRFYVRRFSNNVNRRMKQILYHTLVHKSRVELEMEGTGNVITKAISDVDDCVEGMRKFTTEIFDTGVALLSYVGMLIFYDWKLAILCMIFPPISYFIAEKMKVVIQKNGAAYKEATGKLNAATLDRISNAITYRVFGCESERAEAYEERLKEYEYAAEHANIWNAALPPVYKIISMAGVLFIFYFGTKNVLGIGGTVWDIAVFTTFLSCYTKLSEKSSKAAKLFNSVHKAQVSWKRIYPYMERAAKTEDENLGEAEHRKDMKNAEERSKKLEKESSAYSGQENCEKGCLRAENLTFAYPKGESIFENISFQAQSGQMIGVTGPVACGKSTFGKCFLCEYPYQGHIFYEKKELSAMTKEEQSQVIGYLGHDPELFGDSIKNNILFGDEKDIWKWLQIVSMDQEVKEMVDQEETVVGNSGVKLSGGQAARLALARTLVHKKPIMILDDPFSALDKKTERQIFNRIRVLGKDQIIIILSHRLQMFPEMDQIIWMDQKCAVCGNHETLMQEVPLYEELYHAQEGGNEDECNHGEN